MLLSCHVIPKKARVITEEGRHKYKELKLKVKVVLFLKLTKKENRPTSKEGILRFKLV